MSIFERMVTTENKGELNFDDLSLYGGSKVILEGLTRIHPAVKMNYSDEELLDLLNKAEITKDELKGLAETRILERDKKNTLDYEQKFYDIRSRIDNAISAIEKQVAQ